MDQSQTFLTFSPAPVTRTSGSSFKSKKEGLTPPSHSPNEQERGSDAGVVDQRGKEIGILLPNNQRQHRTLHTQKDALPYALC